MVGTPLRLGDLALDVVLGRGGMGEVWGGVHRVHGVPVAVKILTGPQALRPRWQAAFLDEVRAVAALDHPNVVTLYDHGRVSAEVERASQGRYPEGSPYLVMERVDGGSLAGLRGRLDWPGLYRVLQGLLEALAHAHARGIVHRDLKPHNVMVPAGGEAPVKLTDFGLAHVLDRDAADPYREHLVGTPNYMAPEQILCRWRDFGPWTDLYALGCVAFALATGSPPFAERGDARAVFDAHLGALPPPLVVPGLPEGFETWVARLLEKEPARRYRRAADAAWALLNLAEGRPPLDAEQAAPTSVELRAVADPDATLRVSGAPEGLSILVGEDGPEDAWRPGREAPPVPADWRREVPVRWQPLVGAGLGLYGLRAVPVVGRETERGRLWAALRAVHAEGAPRAVVLRGPSGVGKSRLVHWLRERAEELGAALALEARHSPSPGPGDGLEPMLLRHHGCVGLDRPLLVERLADQLRAAGERNEERWHQLAALVAPLESDEGAPSRGERERVLEGHLRRLARERPVLLWIDDAQWGGDAVAFVRHLLDAPDLPLLAVLTVEAGAEPHAGLRSVERHPSAEVLDLGPLPDAEVPLLVQALLGADQGEVADEVCARVEGNPLFAVHLVGDWVQRGALVAGPRGFRLRPDVPRHLPDGVHGIWVQRVDEAIDGRVADLAALEVAALLGHEVDDAEWRAAVAAAGLAPAGDLLERLVARGLVRRRLAEPTWTFVHGMLRESLLRQAAEAGRRVEHHRACAVALAGATGRGVAERRARHLIAAGQTYQAIDPLLAAARERLGRSDFEEARALLAEWKEMVLRLDPPLAEDDPRRGEAWLLACHHARLGGDLERARKLAHAAESEACAHGWDRVRARVLVDRSWDALDEGDRAGALRLLEEATRVARDLGDERLVASCLRSRAVHLLDGGAAAEVNALLGEALEIYRRTGHHAGCGLSLVNLAQLARRRGRHEAAAEALTRAERAFTEGDVRWGVALVGVERGLLCYEQGELIRAEAVLREAAARFAVIGGVNGPLARLHLARVRAALGDLGTARRAFAELRGEMDRQRRQARALLAELGLLTVAARGRAWDAWAQHADAVEARLGVLRRPTREAIQMAEEAADAAHLADAPRRAARILRLVVDSWRALGEEDEAQRAGATLRELEALPGVEE